ncbi:hypothetical protein RW1_065_00090 [Rhodococcus wratislaviensis NBRC 100605]|uniref:HTH luxR-type domain-containing protein n=1 Tax=Rhodococcus wratislaviensis NBRC 100605 TaxID=1219028 RepID=X0PZC9_RHOWR|nr:hypothetical protein RW1_065_00090 [Rhodococcus wratislaviensis NBRC 100605]
MQASFAGRREREVAAELAGLLRRFGHEQVDFTVVGSGPNGANPHHEAGDRVIERGDTVVLDFGGSRCRIPLRRSWQALNFNTAVAYALNEPHAANAVVPSSVSPPPLTKRELQVAELVAEGLTNKAIATRLVISPRTAQGHVEYVLAKLGFTSRAQVAAWFVDRGPGVGG